MYSLQRLTCQILNGKCEVVSICIAPIRETFRRRLGRPIARTVKGYQFYLHTLRFIRNRKEARAIPPAFGFPAAAGTHLPTQEQRRSQGWAWGA